MSGGHDQADYIYRTFYRPSGEFPNAIVYMMLVNMKHVSAKLYLGSAEPYKGQSPSRIEESLSALLLAVTNALWPTRHSGRGVSTGRVLKDMAPGVATIVFHKNGSVDVVEWNDQISVRKYRLPTVAAFDSKRRQDSDHSGARRPYPVRGDRAGFFA